ncbi:MAG: hypothetical protein IJY25_00745 [Bacilli bacterium]|nr:hypothetical protein [Bacilli bacterium]
MNDLSLAEKTKVLTDMISSSPLFLFCSMIAIALLIFFIICIKRNIKINKWIFIVSWIVLSITVIIAYNSVVLDLIDNLFDSVFMALYFPNLTVYIIILTISNFFFIYSVFNKKMYKAHKILNIVNTVIIDVFLILIIDIVSSNGINVYDELTIFSNKNLLVLLELNSAIFTSWILLSLLVSAHKKLKKYDKKELPKMQEIVFD